MYNYCADAKWLGSIRYFSLSLSRAVRALVLCIESAAMYTRDACHTYVYIRSTRSFADDLLTALPQLSISLRPFPSSLAFLSLIFFERGASFPPPFFFASLCAEFTPSAIYLLVLYTHTCGEYIYTTSIILFHRDWHVGGTFFFMLTSS